MNQQLEGIAALPHLGVIRVEGEDTVSFLQGQLTQDFALLDMAQARLAAFCSAKGRMQASFIGFKRSPAEVLLLCSRDLLAPTLKRLSMFVLRAKVKLSDASADFTLRGLAGNAVKEVAGSAQNAWTKNDIGAASLTHLYPADGVDRALWVAPASEPLPLAAPMDSGLWLWGEVRSGVATVSAPIVDAFVPQMLNYESLGGVSFKKGCYPGQEIVARSQFRGTLKRRAFLVHSAAAMQAGEEVFDMADTSQPCGLVAQAAAAPQGGFDAIVSIQVSAAAGPGLRLGKPDGAAIELLALPYELLEDI